MLAELTRQLGQADAQAYFSQYHNLRNALPPIWEQIKGREPFLSDHGTRHIQNVLENAERILSKVDRDKGLTGVELYCLGIAILFHDVGNIDGRKQHNDMRRIAEIYDHVNAGGIRQQEKGIILRIANAHTGHARDGSKDTLRDFDPEPTMSLIGRPVRVQELAAILRLADELAEGPQRTVEFMRSKGRYPDVAARHHDYASITDIAIDPGNERIAISYNIPIPTPNGSLAHGIPDLRELLLFAFTRLEKLDQERKYARFYSKLLDPLKTVRVHIDFWLNGSLLELNLPPLELNDKTIPGDQCKAIALVNPSYNLDTLLLAIQNAAPQDTSHHAATEITPPQETPQSSSAKARLSSLQSSSTDKADSDLPRPFSLLRYISGLFGGNR